MSSKVNTSNDNVVAADPLGGEWPQDNLGDSGEEVVVTKLVDAPKPKKQAAAPVARRTRIILEDSAEISPSGQFFGADGVGFMLRPGEEADVPDSILNILDTAVMSVPIKDGSDTVVGYRDRLRFPYRVITARRTA
jgi:hypothetical protein